MANNRVIKGIIGKWFKVPINIYQRGNNKFPAGICKEFMKTVEHCSDYYMTYNVRPKKADDFVCFEKTSANAEQFAIIMQGPVISEDNFTLETVRLYNKIFPNVLVIVSTWADSNHNVVKELRNCQNCIVVLNDYPTHSGYMNNNYQTVTTVAGLKLAKEKNIKFVFKTRCDYRFYKRGLLEFMLSLLNDYPCDDKEFGQKFRIIITSGRFDDMFRPFYVGDQFNFGHIDDMLNLWDQDPLDIDVSAKQHNEETRRKGLTWKEERDLSRIMTKRYSLKMRNKDFNNTIEEYWNFAKNNLIFLSAKDADAYWWKYDYKYEETMATGEYYREDNERTAFSYNWNFVSWLNLYHGSLKYEEWMERISEDNLF